MIEMDDEDTCAVVYHGTDPVLSKNETKINPTMSEDKTRLYQINPPMKAPMNQFRTHRYSIKRRDNDWPSRDQVKYLDVTEHNGDNGLYWAVIFEGLGATIIMPDDYKACEVVQET